MSDKSSASRVYGRRKGRPLRVRKSQLMETLLPQLLITLKAGAHTPPQEFFQSSPRATVVEIGFGGGEHLAAQALRHPEMNFIGCEPFVNGVASLLDHLDLHQIGNVRVFNDDARKMLDALPDASIDRCFVLFADPWPKTRHAERRFIGPENLARIARVLKPGGLLRVASDHPSLIAWMRACLQADQHFTCAHADSTPPADWIPTRYQEKAIAAGRTPFFMDYRRTCSKPSFHRSMT
jgi:tRNA (guanine-N7-)-methyltransferase